MQQEPIIITMLGKFSLSWHGQTIDDSDNRANKVWLLLAYLIYNHNRQIPSDEFIRLLWENSEDSTNPQGSFKTMLHRVRAMLSSLDSSAGHDLICRSGSRYTWNDEIPAKFDVEIFDSLCREAADCEDLDKKLEIYLKALPIYRGSFLPKLSMEAWVMPIAVYYDKLYLDALLQALPLLEQSRRKEEAVQLCKNSLEIDPYNEDVYHHLLRNMIDLGQRDDAVRVYEDYRERLFTVFGVIPSESLRNLCREASSQTNNQVLTFDDIKEQLNEDHPGRGALICEYDFFKVLYQAEARSIIRSGETVHICLFTVSERPKGTLSRRSLDLAMKNLQEQIRISLRHGDIVSRSSLSQFLVMLPRANYENSCMVAQRIVRSFARQYPHSPAQISFSVQPLIPSVTEA